MEEDKIKRYLTLVGSLLGATNIVSGQDVIYDPADLVATPGSVVNIQLDKPSPTGGNTDMRFYLTTASFTTIGHWHTYGFHNSAPYNAFYTSYQTFAGASVRGGASIVCDTATGTDPWPEPIETTETIQASMGTDYWRTFGSIMVSRSNWETFGGFVGSDSSKRFAFGDANKYIAVKFNHGAGVRYGWIEFSIAADRGSVTVHRWGYDTGGYSSKPNTGVLPVELVSFHVILEENVPRLNWVTASELNNSHFEIERSSNGIDFVKMAEVLGNGTTTEVNDYSFYDTSPLIGINYYRLKQVDYDGKFEYTSLRSIIIDKTASTFSLFPNPSKGKDVFLKFNGFEEAVFDLKIHNVSGQLVHEEELQLQNSEGIAKVSLSNTLSKGSYIISLIGDNFSKQEPLIVK